MEIMDRDEAIRVQERCDGSATISYRAPELLEVPYPYTLSARTDVFSLGCLLYAFMFYYSPFEHVDSVRLAHQKELSLPENSSELYSAALLELTKHMLNKDADLRPDLQEVQERVKRIYKDAPNNEK